jgi:hypothetical protein
MKKMFFLMLALLIWSAASMNAQVTIGSENTPHPGAVLDLQSTTQGFKLPTVALNDVSLFQLGNGVASNANGIMVFNTSTTTIGGNGIGIYVWWTKWNYIGVVKITDFTLVSSQGTKPAAGVQTVISARNFIPTNAISKSVNWTVLSGPGVIESFTDSTCTVTVGGSGTITMIGATSYDGETIRTMGLFTDVPTTAVWGEGAEGVKNYTSIKFPSSLGEMMAENSREGDPANKTYNNGESDANQGYYYSFEELAQACPVGWHVPSFNELNAVMLWDPTFPEVEEFSDSFIASLDGTINIAGVWGNIGIAGRGWLSDGYFGIRGNYKWGDLTRLNWVPVGEQRYYSVRCFKD